MRWKKKASILFLALLTANVFISYLIFTDEGEAASAVPGAATTGAGGLILQRLHSFASSSGQSHQRPSSWPSIVDVIDRKNNRIIGDDDSAQFLVDFAIVGHGKCGTTSMQRLLSEHPSCLISNHETLELTLGGSPALLVDRMYRELPSGFQYRRGYKSPGEIRSFQSIQQLNRHFPKTTLIVGIRHPCLWFESLHNFKLQNLRPYVRSDFWGDPNTLIDKCPNADDFHCVGTYKGYFHVHLSYLGKARPEATQELQWKYPQLYPQNGTVPIETAVSNPVILFDLQQLSDTNSTRREMFRNDVYRWLKLPPRKTATRSSFPKIKPGSTSHLNATIQADRDRHKIRICNDKYLPIRTELMRMSVEISTWIRTSGFLDHPNVHVSSREYFEELLSRYWMMDPCTGKQYIQQG